MKPRQASVDFTVPGSFFPQGHHLKSGERKRKRADVFKRLKAKKEKTK